MKLKKYLICFTSGRNSANCNVKPDKFGTFSQRGGVPFSQILNENGKNICSHFRKKKNNPCMLKKLKSLHFTELGGGYYSNGHLFIQTNTSEKKLYSLIIDHLYQTGQKGGKIQKYSYLVLLLSFNIDFFISPPSKARRAKLNLFSTFQTSFRRTIN